VKKSELSPLEKEVLHLALVDDLSNEEIARVLSLSYASVANIIKRARRKMQTRTSRVADVRLFFRLRGYESSRENGELSRT
jgi:DNA-directed RNA polymerase specialized sigma24 family protein